MTKNQTRPEKAHWGQKFHKAHKRTFKCTLKSALKSAKKRASF